MAVSFEIQHNFQFSGELKLSDVKVCSWTELVSLYNRRKSLTTVQTAPIGFIFDGARKKPIVYN
jgi:hypothetical protein